MAMAGLLNAGRLRPNTISGIMQCTPHTANPAAMADSFMIGGDASVECIWRLPRKSRTVTKTVTYNQEHARGSRIQRGG